MQFHRRLLCTTVLALLVAVPLHAQGAVRRLPSGALRGGAAMKPLDWYLRGQTLSAMANRGASSTYQTGRAGTATSTVGLNIAVPANGFRRIGAARQEQRGAQICTAESVQMDVLKQNIFNLFRYDPGLPIFPGAFIDASTLLQQTPALIGAPNRAPLTIRIDISNPAAGAPDTTIISDFGGNNLAALNANLRDRHFGAAFPAKIVMRTEEVRSRVEFAAKAEVASGVILPLEEFGIPAEVGSGVEASAGGSTVRDKRRYLMTIVQPMYSYSVTTIDKNRFFVAPGSPAQHPKAVMVASVVFGRRVSILIESEMARDSVEATVRARLGLSVTGDAGGVFDLGYRAEGDAIAKFERNISRFVATFHGGNAARANAVVTDPGLVSAFLTDRSAARLQANTGEVPIEYRLEPVATNGVIGVRSTGTFESSLCEEPVYEVAVQYLGIKALKVVEGPLDDKEDVFGTISVSGKPLKRILEANRQEIRQGETKDDNIPVIIGARMTLDEMRRNPLRFTAALKDWEALIKPEFREAEPAALIYDMVRNERLDRALNAERNGRQVALDRDVQELRLYENGDRQAAAIAVLYQVFVTRR